ncbi:hypothetical protein COU19_00680 [Candidatus Kaiserbacteria bacterium CG10_big_fil_rev_8_21_14_0_10_56_12]|uniref:Uncharacterized protein n=1 Tax=Candidatus Kaiserbacteria bacterium CG10_big_fil_rev_8_21_14_0_10_56_12 TaxID=1974611 RepID=A0A2H0UAF4_9BACT|nr:MAG: hypothetical protein COU19_00680 [Candidatus Kaiserbacteria bacterium CG10_big_fil_rev_8_21_14_0_10_56_12]
MLEERRIADPHLLICVTDADGHEVPGARQLVPLDQVQTRVDFHRPGEHTLHARVVWGPTRKWLRNEYLARESGRRHAGYDCDVFNVDNRLERLSWEAERTQQEFDRSESRRGLSIDKMTVFYGLGLTTRKVAITDELFASPPPLLLVWWLNFPHGGAKLPLDDQCHLRRRVIESLPKLVWAPVAGASLSLCKGVVGILWMLLFPRKHGRYYGGVAFLANIAFGKAFPWDDGRRQGVYWHGSIPMLFLVPMTWIVLLGAGVINCANLGIEMTFWNLLLFGVLGILELLSCVAVILGVILAAEAVRDGTLGNVIDRFLQRWETAEAERSISAWTFDDRYRDLVCDNGQTAFRPLDLTHLQKRPTVIFSELKARVCKPFARS